jgi:hypothetical protein
VLSGVGSVESGFLVWQLEDGHKTITCLTEVAPASRDGAVVKAELASEVERAMERWSDGPFASERHMPSLLPSWLPSASRRTRGSCSSHPHSCNTRPTFIPQKAIKRAFQSPSALSPPPCTGVVMSSRRKSWPGRPLAATSLCLPASACRRTNQRTNRSARGTNLFPASCPSDRPPLPV